MKKFVLAAVAALTLSIGAASAFAAQIGDGSDTHSYGAWVNGKAPAFVYNPGD